jgi:hypothetical protein
LCAAGSDDARGHVGIVTEGDATLLHVRAGYVDFNGIDVGIVEALRNALVFLNSRPGHVRDEARLGKIEAWKDLTR